MGLKELPSGLLRSMKNVKTLHLYNNELCALPSEIALLATLEELAVRLLKQLDRHLTQLRWVQVGNNQLTSLPRELGLLTNEGFELFGS